MRIIQQGSGPFNVAATPPERVRAIFDSDTLAGQVIYITSSGHVDLAQGNGRPQDFAVGIATQNVAAGQFGEYIPVGPITVDTWSLTPGSVYYLSPSSPGGMTTTYPSTIGQFVVVLGTASTPNQLSLSIHWMLEHS